MDQVSAHFPPSSSSSSARDALRMPVCGLPYRDYTWLDVSPEEQFLWFAVTPLIYFHTVEACQPDRCMRQFGLDQLILDDSRKLRGVHDGTLRGKTAENWTHRLQDWIQRWQTRAARIQVPPPLPGLMSPNHGYMEWYRARGKRYISQRAAKIGRTIDALEGLYHATTPEEFARVGLQHIHDEIGRIISTFREEARVCEPGPDAPPSQMEPEPQMTTEVLPHRREGHGIGRRRVPVPTVSVPVGMPMPPTYMGGWYRPHMMGETYGTQSTYYHPSQQAGPSAQTSYYVPSPSARPSTQTSYHPYMESEEPLFQASPMHMAEGIVSQEQYNLLVESLGLDTPDVHPPPAVDSPPPAVDLPPLAMDSPPPAVDLPPPVDDDPWERCRLPDRDVHHCQWPQWS